MAKRDNVNLDLCWVHATATHPRYDDFITFCQQRVAADIPGASLSENRKSDGSQAVVKVTALAAEFDSLPGVVRNAIIRIYSEAELPLVQALVSAVAWTGPPAPV